MVVMVSTMPQHTVWDGMEKNNNTTLEGVELDLIMEVRGIQE